MGKRLVPGDLCTCVGSNPEYGLELWRTPAGSNLDVVTVLCGVGVLLSTERDKDWKVTMALVLDNASGKVGWCDLNFLKRVK